MTTAENTQALDNYAKKIAEAKTAEEENRALAYWERRLVAGVVIRALTLRDWRLLVESGNMLFNAHGPEQDLGNAAVDFLEYQRVGRKLHWWNRAKFKHRFWRNPVMRPWVIAEVQDYLASVYQDTIFTKPKNGGLPGEARWSYEAMVIDTLGERYGWAWRDILDMPLAVIRQQMNIIHAENIRKNGERVDYYPNESDKLKSQWLQILNARGGGN